MADLSTPTGEVVHVGALDVNMLADPGITAILAGAIDMAEQGAGTTHIVPGSRQRYAIVVDHESGQYGISVSP